MNHAVLIEDSPFIRMQWEFVGGKSGVQIATFGGLKDFLSCTQKPQVSTPIFIDYELGNEHNGLEVAQMLSRLGYKSLYLCTCHSEESISPPAEIIKGVVGKEPPAWLLANGGNTP